MDGNNLWRMANFSVGYSYGPVLDPRGFFKTMIYSRSNIFKNGSKSDLNNYRPISVIPTVAKIFEKIIYDQLYQYLSENGWLNSGQSGFRSLHSTLTALLETNDNWCVNIDRGLLNGVIFIDF